MARLLLALVVAAPAFANPADEARERVLWLLSAVHELPTKAAFEKASSDARALVLAVARDPKVVGPQRTRALEALRYWPDQAALDVHVAALSEPALQQRALRLLGGFGERGLDALAPYLRHADPQVRATAVAAVADVKGTRAGALLRATNATETLDWVRARLQKALDRQALELR